MFVTDIRCWCLTLDVGDVTCHQHIWSPTSVTNIDVTMKMDGKLMKIFDVTLVHEPNLVLDSSALKTWNIVLIRVREFPQLHFLILNPLSLSDCIWLLHLIH